MAPSAKALSAKEFMKYLINKNKKMVKSQKKRKGGKKKPKRQVRKQKRAGRVKRKVGGKSQRKKRVKRELKQKNQLSTAKDVALSSTLANPLELYLYKQKNLN